MNQSDLPGSRCFTPFCAFVQATSAICLTAVTTGWNGLGDKDQVLFDTLLHLSHGFHQQFRKGHDDGLIELICQQCLFVLHIDGLQKAYQKDFSKENEQNKLHLCCHGTVVCSHMIWHIVLLVALLSPSNQKFSKTCVPFCVVQTLMIACAHSLTVKIQDRK